MKRGVETGAIARRIAIVSGQAGLGATGSAIARLNDMTDQERQTAEALLSRIELATGEIQDRRGPNATLIKSIIESVNGLRSLLSIVRPH